MTYNIIATGSGGNAVVINDKILIDCGVPYKRLEPVVKSLKLVLLTHVHSDHFRPRTAAALHRERPTLRFGCCSWMVQPLLDAGVNRRAIDVYTPELCYEYRGLCTLTPQPLTHCVPNCGYHLSDMERSRLFYATDTATLDGIDAKGYDLYMIEANHVKEELEARRDAKIAAGEYAYEFNAARNHLSQEQAEDWLYKNMCTNSRYVFLHQHKEVCNV